MSIQLERIKVNWRKSLNKPNNLFPNICRVAQGIYEKLNIYGIVEKLMMELVLEIILCNGWYAHLSALNYLSKNKNKL